MRNMDTETDIKLAYCPVRPTKERRRQNGGLIAEVIDRDIDGKPTAKRYRAAWECPLDAYLHFGAISKKQHVAGLLFGQVYGGVVAAQKEASSWKIRDNGKDTPSRSQQLLREAFRVLSPECKGALIDVCAFREAVTDRAKLLRLQKGLSELVILWKAAAEEILVRKKGSYYS